MENFLATEGLSVGYDGRELIKDICIALPKGRILTLIGPNGAGKSTILRSITKYLKTIRGTVYIGGSLLDDMTNRDLSYKVSVVFTQKLKTELMTCREVVETGRYPYTGRFGLLSDGDREKVRDAMELVSIAELADRDFMRVSDGQRQRVLLARAICQEPEMIVLDEPTSFLDVRYELELLDILRTMTRERGVAVIMSLHELDLAQRISDDVMCVSGDRITHYGPADEIFTRELIHELYGLTEGGYNPLFGSLEMRRARGEAKIFVISGGGTGINVFRRLQREREPFFAGVLHENDVDYQVARDLAAEVVSERGFERIGDGSFARAVKLMDGCERVINCLETYGEMNARNRDLLLHAAECGKQILRPEDMRS